MSWRVSLFSAIRLSAARVGELGPPDPRGAVIAGGDDLLAVATERRVAEDLDDDVSRRQAGLRDPGRDVCSRRVAGGLARNRT